MLAPLRKELGALFILTLLAGCQASEERGTREKTVREVGDSSAGRGRSRAMNAPSTACRESAADAVLDANDIEWERALVGTYDLTVVEDVVTRARSTIRGR